MKDGDVAAETERNRDISQGRLGIEKEGEIPGIRQIGHRYFLGNPAPRVQLNRMLYVHTSSYI